MEKSVKKSNTKSKSKMSDKTQNCIKSNVGTSKSKSKRREKNSSISSDFIKNINIKKFLTKNNITYFVLAILNIALVIYMARKNVVNYAVVFDEEILVGNIRYLLFGRNFVNLIIIVFVYIYTCLVTKFFLRNKLTKQFLLWLFVIVAVVNVLLFFIFTNRVY